MITGSNFALFAATIRIECIHGHKNKLVGLEVAKQKKQNTVYIVAG